MTTQKAKAATAPEVTKSITIGIKDSTLEAVNAAAEVVGAPKDVTFNLGNAPYMPGAPNDNPEAQFPYQVTFTWTESL